MALYLVLSSGPTPDEALPLLAVADRRIIDSLLSAIRRIAVDEDEPVGPRKRRIARQGGRHPLRVVEEVHDDARD